MADRVLALYPSAYLESTPCVWNLLECLAEDGVGVELLTLEAPGEPSDPAGVTVERFSTDGRLLDFVRQADKHLSGRAAEFAGVLAIDRGGLLAASGLKRRAGIAGPRVYLSTEIFVPPVFTGLKNKIANKFEALLARRSAMVISPSAERAAEHSRLFGISAEKTAALPNSPRGDADGAARTGEFAQRLAISPSAPIILYAGSLTPPNRIKELLAEAADYWPAEWTLVLNSRVPLSRTEALAMDEWKKRAKCRIVVFDKPTDADELHRMCRGSNVGIALYREDGLTFQSVGTASGKIAQYFKAGLPVVATPLASLQDLVEGSGAGVCARVEKGELREAIQRILADESAYRMAAAKCFDERFHFDRAYRALAPRLHASLGLAPSSGAS
ncbi:glycosyltransferase family 4 protein [bacterium]|nr:glycosyltransferase family 4 protein [bacterium]